MLDKTDDRDAGSPDDADDKDDPNVIYYAVDTFQASSSARNGTLIRFTSPAIRVGNILGEKTKALAADDTAVTADADYAGRDTLERKVTITPKHVFAGEKEHKFTISFTATGPMYGATLTIPIPDGLRPTGAALDADGDDADDDAANVFNFAVSFGKSAGVMAGATGTFPLSGSGSVQQLAANTLLVTGTVSGITFTLTKIDIGQRVFVTYTLPQIGAAASDFLLADGTSDAALDITTDMEWRRYRLLLSEDNNTRRRESECVARDLEW